MNRQSSEPRLLRDAIVSHVESCTLSEEKLAALRALTPSGESRPRETSRRPRWRAIALVATLVVGISTGYFLGRAPTPSVLLERIAEEAVQNHVLRMPLEVAASRVADTRAYFHHLSFDVTEPTRVLRGASFLGGRYCSLQGAAAAQLRYRETESAVVTLYQVPLNSTLHALLPTTRSVEGHRVDMWREGDVMHVQVDGALTP